MELIDLIKQYARKQYLVVAHYPRDHLAIAAGLFGLFLILLALPEGDEPIEAAGRTEIALAIDLSAASEPQQQPDTEARRPAGSWRLRTANNRKVIVKVPEPRAGDTLAAVITKHSHTTFFGEMVPV